MAKSFQEKMRQKAAQNPAMMFISQAKEPQTAPEELEALEEITAASNEGRSILPVEKSSQSGSSRKPAPPRKEAKSRRLQLLIQPSLYEDIRDRAEAEGLSVNETISELLKQALKG